MVAFVCCLLVPYCFVQFSFSVKAFGSFTFRSDNMSERCRSRSPPRGTGHRDGSRCPVCGKIPASQKNLQSAKAECEDLKKTLQLVQSYLQDAKKMEICRETLLEFQKETIWKAAETLQGVTEKLGENPYLMPM